MEIMLICLNVFFIFMAGSLSFVSKFLIDAIKTMSGATFHPFVVMLLMSDCFL